MVEQAQQRIQQAITQLIDEIDKAFLRGMQRTMHECAVRCCSDNESSVDQVHRCIESCSTPLTQAQSYVQNELSQFQERLQRCVMVCQDKVKDQVTVDLSESQDNEQKQNPKGLAIGAGKLLREAALGTGGVSVYKAEFEACALHCVDEHIQLMPSVKKRIASTLNKS